jgi:pyruvate, water dikinase
MLGFCGAARYISAEFGEAFAMQCEAFKRVRNDTILAAKFLEYCDGFSLGSSDLTQLTLGLDRDSGLEPLAKDFDERDPAVKAMLEMAIKACRAQNKYVGICAKAPATTPTLPSGW